jgi:hypothetical protein
MQAILLSREEVAQRANLLYEETIREQVEREENIGKMVIIDIETGEYANVLAMGRRPLLGTALLDECQLLAQFTEGGAVTIDEL